MRFVALALGMACAACALEQRPEAGGLIVVVETDMTSPKDIDQLRLDVVQSQQSLLHAETALDEKSTLTREFRVPTTKDRALTSVRAVAWKAGHPRVERSAVVHLPSAYWGVLRLSIDYLCAGRVTDAGVSSCGADRSCQDGTCAASGMTAPLPHFDSQAGSVGDAGAGSCLDVPSCFVSAAAVTLDTDSCSFEVPDADATDVGVALRLPQDGAGSCDSEACWVVLDTATDGVRRNGARIELPARVCELREQDSDLSVVVSDGCGASTGHRPICNLPRSESSHVVPVTDVALGLGTLVVVGDACVGPAVRACGRCGTSARTCQDGAWSSFAACSGEGECEPDAAESCADQGARSCGGDCTWSACESLVCEGPATRACGHCGTEVRTCDADARAWSQWSACTGEGECAPDSTRSCGVNGTQTCAGNCQWDSACAGQFCAGLATRACGQCGTQTRRCDTSAGTWSAWSTCSNEGECAAGASRMCEGRGTQLCQRDCRWSESCPGLLCDGRASAAAAIVACRRAAAMRPRAAGRTGVNVRGRATVRLASSRSALADRPAPRRATTAVAGAPVHACPARRSAALARAATYALTTRTAAPAISRAGQGDGATMDAAPVLPAAMTARELVSTCRPMPATAVRATCRALQARAVFAVPVSVRVRAQRASRCAGEHA